MLKAIIMNSSKAICIQLGDCKELKQQRVRTALCPLKVGILKVTGLQ